MATDRRRCSVLSIFVITLLLNLSSCKSELTSLNEENWHQMLKGEWMVEFFAPWCPACMALEPIWKDFAGWSVDLEIFVGQVDVTESPGLSGRFMVTALPTIYHVKDGVFRQYRGSRDKEDLMNFIEEKKWEEVEEISPWKSPSSFQMSIVSQFFKLSMVLRGFHSTLVEEYGLPPWGSYLVFALATIVVGALLGLILVCVIDFVFPPKSLAPEVTISSPEKKEDDDEEDLVEGSDAERENPDDAGEDSQENVDEELSVGEESEAEEEEESKEAKSEDANSQPSSSPEVRKRRARKAD